MNKNLVLAIPQLTGGGAERVVSVWANELSKKGYHVSIILFFRSKDEYYTDGSVKIFSITENHEEYIKLSFIKRFQRIRKLLKKIKPDYVISFLPPMQVWILMASIGLGTKRIETIRNNPWRISVTNCFHKVLWKQCYHSCYRIILQSSDQGPFFNKKDQKKCIVIPNPISELYIKNYKEEISEFPTEFIAVGRITPQKNYKMMIKAFADVCKEYRHLRLRIFGTGKESYVSEIKDYISELQMQDNIFLMGRTPHMEEQYKNSDIFLMTSDYEGLPNALIEAMASQLICISTNCKTGPKDLIDEGENGFLVPVGNSAKLSEVIRLVLRMPKEERAKIAKSARIKVLSYCSQENSVDFLCKLII
jgi:GalNAc-alpha-(1->4)-GalNAc-alpha-(1->3)-diNAcBac-PP-undecaprenol alpha-1,4-N-acetyl-D-galactosaminyltransferase